MLKIFLSWLLLTLTAQVVISQNLVETFHRTGFNNSGTLKLYDNNTFIAKYSAVSCVVGEQGKKTTSEEIHGDYFLRDNNIHFSPEYKLSKGYNDEVIQRSNGYVAEQSFFKFNYDIIEYKGKRMLFSVAPLNDDSVNDLRFDNHYIYFANLLNKSDDETYFESDFWQGEFPKDEPIIFRKDLKSKFPEGYKDYILDKPIKGKVTTVQKISFLNPDMESNPQWNKYRITLNIGKEDGVKPMMIFYGKEECNSNRCSITIQDVFAHECSGYIQNYQPHYNCSLETIFTTNLSSTILTHTSY